MKITIDIPDGLEELFPGLKDIKGSLYNVLFASRMIRNHQDMIDDRLAVSVLIDYMEVEHE